MNGHSLGRWRRPGTRGVRGLPLGVVLRLLLRAILRLQPLGISMVMFQDSESEEVPSIACCMAVHLGVRRGVRRGQRDSKRQQQDQPGQRKK